MAWLDGGIVGLKALPRIQKASHPIILDARRRSESRACRRTHKMMISSPLTSHMLPVHQVALADALAVAALRGTLPTRRCCGGLPQPSWTRAMRCRSPSRSQMGAVAASAVQVLTVWVKPLDTPYSERGMPNAPQSRFASGVAGWQQGSDQRHAHRKGAIAVGYYDGSSPVPPRVERAEAAGRRGRGKPLAFTGAA